MMPFRARGARLFVSSGPSPHRYWRTLFPLATAATYMGIGEMEWISALTTNIDLTNNSDAATKASQSDFQLTGTEGRYVFDEAITNLGGSPSYGFWQAFDGANKWISYDFTTPVTIDRIRLYPNPDGSGRSPTCVVVQYSDNGTTWFTDWGFNYIPTAATWRDFLRTTWIDRSFDDALSLSTNLFTGATLRTGFPADYFRKLGAVNSFKLGFKAVGGPLEIANCRVGLRSTAVGDWVTFLASPAPVYATFGGNASSGTQTAGTSFLTDTINFAFNTLDFELAIYTGPGGGNCGYIENYHGIIAARRAGSDDTGNNTPTSGYTYPYGTGLNVLEKFIKIS